MSKVNKYTNSSFLIILLSLSASAVYRHFENGVILSLNNYLAFVCLVISLIIWLVKSNIVSVAILILLLLGTINIINFTAEVFKLSYFGMGSDSNSLSLNPIGLPLLIIYCIVNRSAVKGIAERLTYGPDMDQFYYKKFNSNSQDELNKIFADFNDYPPEAQIALNKLKREKDNN
ncbi:MAG: hypothetical protein JWP78_857 [Mucilaginibacter sp.]|nr:hypothetical protein [Mucilaginibacter sp.]